MQMLGNYVTTGHDSVLPHHLQLFAVILSFDVA